MTKDTVKQPGETSLYSDQAGNLVQVLWTSTSDSVEFTRQGGGFVQKASRADFERQFKPATVRHYYLSAVTADWLPGGLTVPAYTNGMRWNGWAMPFFTFEAATQLLEHMPDLRYDSVKDVFYSQSSDEDVFDATTLEVDGSKIKTYAIGAGCWCWDLAYD